MSIWTNISQKMKPKNFHPSIYLLHSNVSIRICALAHLNKYFSTWCWALNFKCSVNPAKYKLAVTFTATQATLDQPYSGETLAV